MYSETERDSNKSQTQSESDRDLTIPKMPGSKITSCKISDNDKEYYYRVSNGEIANYYRLHKLPKRLIDDWKQIVYTI